MNEEAAPVAPPAAPESMEERKFKEETRLKELELAIRRDELTAKIAADKRQHGANFSPLNITVIVAFISFLSSLVVNSIQENARLTLERQKFEWQLVQRAVQTDDTKKATQNLSFLLKTGYLKDTDGRISEVIGSPKSTLAGFQSKPPSSANDPSSDINLQEATISELETIVSQLERTVVAQVKETEVLMNQIGHLSKRTPPAR